MDNTTILILLIFLLGINLVLTLQYAAKGRILFKKFWLWSAFFLFAGFGLLYLQRTTGVFLSILLANYLILLGFFLQTGAALLLEDGDTIHCILFVSLLSLVYWILFPLFTLVAFNTSLRILIISLLMVVIYGNALLRYVRYTIRKGALETVYTRELVALFAIAALFYLVRSVFTFLGFGKVSSLLDQNMVVSISLIFPMLFNVVFMIGMYMGDLRKQQMLVISEKDKLSALFHFLNDTARHLEIKELYPSIEEVLKSYIGVDTAAIYLKESGTDRYSIVHYFNKLNLNIDQVMTLREGQGLTGRAVMEDRVVSMDIASYPNESLRQDFQQKGCTDLLSVPLKTGDGIIGAITMAYSNRTNAKIKNLDKDFFYYLGEQIALVMQNARMYEQLSRMASTDPLTGLYNRRKMIESIENEAARARRYETGMTLALLDMDWFKSINDSYGHDCGDEVLKEAADVIRQFCRETDVLCRWGGEEFLLAFIQADAEVAGEISERIRSRIEKLTLSCIGTRSLSVSIGIAPYDLSLSLTQNVSRADKALYKAKEKGRNRMVFYEEIIKDN